MKRAVQMLVLLCVLALVGIMVGCSGGNGAAGEAAMDSAAGPQPQVLPTATVSRIAFDKVVARTSQVFLMNTDGTGVTQVTTKQQGTNFGACWSPDGQYLCVTSDRGGVGKALWRIDTNGANPVQLTFPATSSEVHEWAAWSPDGQWIAFVTGVGTAACKRIFVLNVASGDVQQLTFNDLIVDGEVVETEFSHGMMDDFSPTFSPDSVWVMFSSDPYAGGGTGGLFAVPVTGGAKPVRRTVDGVKATQPDWCPLEDDAGVSTVVYSDLYDLFTIAVDAQGVAQSEAVPVATANAGDERKPSVSPDGQWVACSRSGSLIRLKLNSETPDELNLGTGANPAWSPAPGGGGNQPPVANAGSDQTVAVDQDVSFDGSGSYDPDGTIVSYDWDFGDGSSDSGVAVTHSYPFADVYAVTLTVVDNDGAHAGDTCQVTVTSGGATGGMHVSGITWATSGPHLVVTVSVSADSAPVGGAVVAMTLSMGTGSWSFTGTTDSAGRVSFMHKRAASGDYTATVTNINHGAYEYDPTLDLDNPDQYTL